MFPTLALLSFFFIIASARSQDSAAVFNAANKSYEQGKYSEAANAYEKMIQSGSVSAPVYFNLGNAYLKSSQLGRAIVAYRKAEKISPRDPDVRANLTFARGQASGGTVVSSRIWQRFLGALTLNEWAIITSSAVSLWFILLALRQWRVERKKSFRGIIFALGIVCGLLLVCLSAVVYKNLYARSSVVIVPEAVVRLGPLDESQSAFTLRDGAEVTVLDQKNDWLQIADAKERNGWIPQKQVMSVESDKQ